MSAKGVVEIPKEYALYQNYPNPFNPTTKIKYDLPIASKVTLKVYNLLGQEVATLRDEIEAPGFKSVELNGSTLSSGVSAKGGYASGVYFYRLTAGEFISTKKFLLLK